MLLPLVLLVQFNFTLCMSTWPKWVTKHHNTGPQNAYLCHLVRHRTSSKTPDHALSYKFLCATMSKMASYNHDTNLSSPIESDREEIFKRILGLKSCPHWNWVNFLVQARTCDNATIQCVKECKRETKEEVMLLKNLKQL